MPMTFKPKQTKQLLADPELFATTAVLILLDTYGTEALDWTPETVRMELEADFGPVPQTTIDRLFAANTLLTTDCFYKSLPDFIELCNILSGESFTPGVFDPADAEECAWGITEALLIYPPDEENPFSDEVRAYVGKVTEMEGMVVPPDILKIGMGSKTLSKIHGNFSDDKDLFSAIWEAEASKTKDINDGIKSRLTALVMQLEGLTLRVGNTKEIAQKMLSNLNSRNTEGSPLP